MSELVGRSDRDLGNEVDGRTGRERNPVKRGERPTDEREGSKRRRFRCDGDAATPRREAATMGGLPFDLADERRILEPGRVIPYHAGRTAMRGQPMLGVARRTTIEPYGFAGLFVVAALGGEPAPSAPASPDHRRGRATAVGPPRRGGFAPSRTRVAADAAGGTGIHAPWVRLRHTPCSVRWARDGMTARPRRKVRGEMTRRRRNERA